MKRRNRLFGGALAAMAVGLGACSQDSMGPGLGPDVATFNTAPTGYIDVYKIGPAGTYEFEASETVASGLNYTSFFVDAGSRKTIWSQGDPLAAATDVTVTELPSDGVQVDSVIVVIYTDKVQTLKETYTGTNSVTVEAMTNLTDASIKFFNSFAPPPPPPPPGGGTEGCTPGYWKQPHHFDSWVGYLPTDSFDAVFGVTYGGTLLDGASAKGGKANALARHAVAALLNASSSVDYAANTAEVISAVQTAFASGDYETQKNVFEEWNEMGCPLN